MGTQKKKSARFKKGQSGNAKGRPKGSRNKSNAELQALIDEHSDIEGIIKAFTREATRKKLKNLGYLCGLALLEHRYGQAPKRVDLTSDGDKIAAAVFVVPAFNNTVTLPDANTKRP